MMIKEINNRGLDLYSRVDIEKMLNDEMTFGMMFELSEQALKSKINVDILRDALKEENLDYEGLKPLYLDVVEHEDEEFGICKVAYVVFEGNGFYVLSAYSQVTEEHLEDRYFLCRGIKNAKDRQKNMKVFEEKVKNAQKRKKSNMRFLRRKRLEEELVYRAVYSGIRLMK